MSFDWNLSSDEENDFDDWSNENLYASIASNKKKQRSCDDGDDDASSDDDDDGDDYNNDFNNNQNNKKRHATVAFPAEDYEEDMKDNDDGGEGGEEDDDIDWEDAGGGEDNYDDKGHASATPELAADNSVSAVARLKPVTLDMNENKEEENMSATTTTNNNTKTKTKRRYRYEHLSPGLQSFLMQLERTHLLSSTGHAIFASRYCSNDIVLNVAHSLIPSAWMVNNKNNASDTAATATASSSLKLQPPAPTEEDLSHFCHFFFSLTNRNNYHQPQYATNRRQGGRRGVATRRNGQRKREVATTQKSRRRSSGNATKEDHDVGGNNTKHQNPISTGRTLRYRTLDYCEHLARNNDGEGGGDNVATNSPNKFGPYDKVHLLISMARSLGWRARYVMSIDPINRDLDVNHPIFVASATKNVFQRLWLETGGTSKKNKKQQQPQKKRARKENQQYEETTDDDDDDGDKKPKAKDPSPSIGKGESPLLDIISRFDSSTPPPSPPVCWVEILCRSTAADQREDNEPKKKKAKRLYVKKMERDGHTPKMKWIHVDPQFCLVNEPDKVESILYAKRQQEEGSKATKMKKKSPVSYAIAAEHVLVSTSSSGGDNGSSQNDLLRTRVTDVSPRYAFSWTDTLKQRGILRGKQTKVDENERPDKWLSATIKSVNSNDENRKKVQELRSKGTTRNDAIVLDNDETMDEKRSKGKDVNDAIILDDNEDSKVGNSTKTNINGDDEMHDHDELDELKEKSSMKNEPIPTSKTAFKSHPVYVIPSILKANEILVPDAKKRVCGVFKGELVFRRSDVETAFPEKQWLYKGRKVKQNELRKPVLRVKARKKPASSGFKALKSYGVGETNDGSKESQQKQKEAATRPLDDGKVNLYASWQTDRWNPPRVNPGDPIPVNDYNNVELALLNPGLVHVDKQRIAVVAKKLSIPYAPCLLGFEGHGGNRTPTIRGIVVHQHNAELLLEAHVEMASQILEQTHEEQQSSILKKWKRILVGVLTKERLERDYGGSDGE